VAELNSSRNFIDDASRLEIVGVGAFSDDLQKSTAKFVSVHENGSSFYLTPELSCEGANVISAAGV
jgi:hypothetical protein